MLLGRRISAWVIKRGEHKGSGWQTTDGEANAVGRVISDLIKQHGSAPFSY